MHSAKDVIKILLLESPLLEATAFVVSTETVETTEDTTETVDVINSLLSVFQTITSIVTFNKAESKNRTQQINVKF